MKIINADSKEQGNKEQALFNWQYTTSHLASYIEAESWTDNEVLERWTHLYTGPRAVQQWRANTLDNPADYETLNRLIAKYRNRLGDLGWFMKCLNEPIARQANKEDGCTGHFWESRYKSQALLSEEALLTCMAYVDLNPVRADMCNTPEESDYTSIKERIAPSFDLVKATDDEIKQQRLQRFDLPLKPLAPFEGNVTSREQIGILFNLEDYLQLVDTTGRMIRPDKRGAIPINLPPILERLSINHQQWLQQSQQFERLYASQFAKKRRTLQKTAWLVINNQECEPIEGLRAATLGKRLFRLNFTFNRKSQTIFWNRRFFSVVD